MIPITIRASHQPVHLYSMTRVQVYPSLNSLEAVEGARDQRSLWSDCADAQSDLSFRWSHRLCRAFAHILGHFLICNVFFVSKGNLFDVYQIFDLNHSCIIMLFIVSMKYIFVLIHINCSSITVMTINMFWKGRYQKKKNNKTQKKKKKTKKKNRNTVSIKIGFTKSVRGQ